MTNSTYGYVEQRVYRFPCKVCGGKRRQTVKRGKAKDRICTKCLKAKVDENQMRML